MSGGGGAGGVDIPPADTGEPPTTAPWANPAAGGPGSYPAPSPTPTPTAAQTPGTPQQWGPGTNFVPMPAAYPAGTPDPNATPPGGTPAPTPPPYVYNDPYGTGTPGNVPLNPNQDYGGIPAPGSADPTGGGIPAPGTAEIPGGGPTPGPLNDQMPLPTNQPQGGPFNVNALGNFFRSLGAMFPGDMGGFGQPMGYFGVPGQNPQGMFGVGGPTMQAGGGSYFGGSGSLDIPGGGFFNNQSSPSSIEGLGGKLAWHMAQPMFGGRTLAQVARENPELLQGLSSMGGNGPGSGAPAQQTGGGHVGVSAT